MAAAADRNEYFGKFIDKEIQTMDIFLTAKAVRTAVTIDEYIQTRLIQGASKDSLYAELIKDLEEGGRIFGEFRSAIRASSNGIINRARDGAVFSAIGIDTKYRWVAVLVNTCPDCLERHGQVKSWDEWEADGMPRTGITVCKENCRCILLPEDTTELDPIQRAKR